MKNKNNIISIHSLHTEGDRPRGCPLHRQVYFNPLPPHGGRLPLFCNSSIAFVISIHSLHTEGDWRKCTSVYGCGISIHSLHTEGDPNFEHLERWMIISIHSLHTEGDEKYPPSTSMTTAFQSTPSTRRETVLNRIDRIVMRLFPSTRRETHGGNTSFSGIPKFQSTPSTRRETRFSL